MASSRYSSCFFRFFATPATPAPTLATLATPAPSLLPQHLRSPSDWPSLPLVALLASSAPFATPAPPPATPVAPPASHATPYTTTTLVSSCHVIEASKSPSVSHSLPSCH